MNVSTVADMKPVHFEGAFARICIASLPNNVLLMIFKHAFQSSRTWRFYMPANNSRPEVYETQWKDTKINELTTPTLFPYAIAAVCTRWRENMSTVPEFWTRVVIMAVPHGSSETFQSPTYAHSYFEWSRDLILDVTIIGYQPASGGEPDDTSGLEKAGVAAASKCLAPHIKRCKTIRYSVDKSSSLPYLVKHFFGVASKLSNLHLDCRVDNGGDAMKPTKAEVAERRSWPFVAPDLYELKISGPSFRDLCVARSSWLSVSRCLRDLVISHYRPSSWSRDLSFSMYDIFNVMAQIDSLHSLTLTDVELDPIRSVRKNYTFGHPNFDSIIFEDVGVKVLNDFFRLSKETYFEFIAIVRSQVDSLRRMAPSHSLLLKDLIGEDDVETILDMWAGEELEIENCPSFNDSVLSDLTDGGYMNRSFRSSHLYEIEICDCPNFTVPTLKAMVENRKQGCNVHTPNSPNTSRVFSPSTIELLTSD